MTPPTSPPPDTPSTRQRLLSVVLLAAFGVGFGLALIALLMRLVPGLEPGGTRFILTELDGDIFRHQPGLVKPPQTNRVLEDIIRYDDADGFRRPAWVADHYPIAAIGDSFTDGGQVPWVDVLAETVNVPVRNLGFSGYGPLEYAAVAQTYLADDHTWVLVAYFEGNDLSNTRSTWQRIQRSGEPLTLDLTRQTAPPILEPRSLEDYSDIVTNDDGWYLYPLKHLAIQAELAYINGYIWWLNGEADTYRTSRNLEEVRAAFADIRAAAGDACVGLVYVPTKAHIYLEHADPDGNRQFVLENAEPLEQNANGWLRSGGITPVDWDTLHGRMGNQRDVIREAAEDSGMTFIDLVPALQAAVTTGPQSYYSFDSHWNERGHRIAGETVAAAIQDVPGCPLTR